MFRDDVFVTDEKSRRFRLSETFRVGRPVECDLSHPDAGNVFFVLHQQPLGAVLLANLGLMGSVSVNGKPLTSPQQTLTTNTIIEFAGHRLQLAFVPQKPLLTEVLTRLAEREPSLLAMKVAGDALIEQGHPVGPPLAQGTLLPLPRELEHAVLTGVARFTTFGSFIDTLTFAPTVPSRIIPSLHATLRADVGQLVRTLQMPTIEPVYGLHTLPIPALRTLRFGPCLDDVALRRAERELGQFPFPRPLERVVIRVQRSFLTHRGRRHPLTHGSDLTVSTLSLRWTVGLGFLPHTSDPNGQALVNDKLTTGLALLPGDVVQAGRERFTYEAE